MFRGPRDVWEQFHEEHTRSVYRRVLDSGLVTFLGQHNSTLLLPSARGHAILVGTFIDVIDLATCPDRIHAQRASQQKKGLVTLFEKHTHEDLGFAARSVVFFLPGSEPDFLSLCWFQETQIRYLKYHHGADRAELDLSFVLLFLLLF